MPERSFEKIGQDDAGAANVPPPPEPEAETEKAHAAIEEVVSPEQLQMLALATDGFRFEADPRLEAEALETGRIRTGYTNKETKVIYYNPLLLRGSPELGIKPWRTVDIRGFTYHEAGHHAPEVLALDEKLTEQLKNPELIPEFVRGDPKLESEFLQALYSHLDNGLLDMWLESYMGRYPWKPVAASIAEFQTAKGNPETYQTFSKPEQLIQALLRSRYFDQKDVQGKLAPDVYEAYERIMRSPAMATLLDRKDFERFFAAPADHERAIARKFAAYETVFLPEYLKLLENEFKKQKEEQEQGKQGEKEKGEGEKGGEEGKEGKPQELTEKEKEILKKILEQLKEAGKEFKPLAPSEQDEKRKQRMFTEIQRRREEAEKKGAKTVKEKKEKPEEEHGLEALHERMEKLRRESEERTGRALAEAMGVSPETVRRWQEIKESRRIEIESLAASLADVFLDDRRKRMEYMRREGEIVPGLEYETVAALLSGELDPDTKMREVRNPEFLETELEFIVDASDSMAGEKIEKSVETLVMVVEALKRVKEALADENLLAEDEEPFRVGVTTFSITPTRVTRTSEPLNDKKEATIIEKAGATGGGTEETGALEEVYRELTLEKKNVLKIIAVLTDGAGNREGVRPIIQQVEDDNEVLFLALGLGESKEAANGVVQTYLEPLKSREGNVFGYAAEKPEEITPAMLEFLKREVAKRRTV